MVPLFLEGVETCGSGVPLDCSALSMFANPEPATCDSSVGSVAAFFKSNGEEIEQQGSLSGVPCELPSSLESFSGAQEHVNDRRLLHLQRSWAVC